MSPQTYNIQNYSTTIANNFSLFYDQNKHEDENNKNKCEKTIDNYLKENVYWTKNINLHKNKENVKYYNNESNENNYSDIKSVRINNLEIFTAYFDKSKIFIVIFFNTIKYY